MAKKKNEWLYRALCAALAVTLISGTAVMTPVADIVGTNITANAAYEDYTEWTATGTDENGNSATVTCYWKIDNGKLYIAGTIPNKSSGTIPWNAYRKSITEVYAEEGTKTSADAEYLFYELSAATKMDLSNLDTSNATKMPSMFSGCSSLKSLDLSGWDTSNVTNMSSMFRDCTALESLNLSGWNTSSVIYMGDMFRECKALTALDLSSFNTEKVTSMYQMFYMCNALTTLNLSSFDTSKVDNMQEMFYMCNALTTLDLSSFDTSSVTTMYVMFGRCSNLETIYVSDGWNTDSVTNSNSNYMFSNCTNLVGGNETTFDSSKIDKTYAHIDGGTSNPGYFTQGPAPAKTYTITWKNYDGTTLETDENVEEGTTPEYNGTTPTKEGNARYTYTFSGWDNELTAVTGDVTYTAQFTETDRYAGYTEWTATGTDENGNETNVTCYWKVENGKLCIAGTVPNTPSTSDIPWYNDSSIRESITEVYAETGARLSATSSYLFYSLSKATSMDLSNLDTSAATNMSSMFYYCSAVTSLDLSGFDTSKVTNMEGIFNKCEKLTSLNMNGWDTSSVTNMSYMFSSCKALTSLDVSGWNTSSVTNMSNMFYFCSALTSLDLSGWDTSSVTSMENMFYCCSALTSLNVSGWKTYSVTTMKSMFYGCSALTSLDVSGWDTKNVTNMFGMFQSCSALTKIYSDKDWDTSNVTSHSLMFSNCGNLVGGQGTAYSSSKTNKTYARIDGGPESDTPGYFTINPIIAQGDYWKVTDEDGDGSYKLVLFGTIPNTYGNNDSSKIPWYTYRKNITEVTAEEGAKTSAEASRLFADLENAASMDLSNLDTSDATQMFRMFANCKALTTLDLRGWDTSNVTDMERMFNECRNLTSLNLSGWNTSSVTDMDSIFYYCDSLTSLDMSGWDTKNVTDMYNMFGYCKALTSLDVSGWNTSSVTTMREMFCHCESLTPLDVSSWDTKNVTNMLMMFTYCKAFTSLDLSSWDTGNVTSTSCMFYGCQNLATLDLSGWNTSKVSNMSYMFNECGNLVTVYVGSDWNTSAVNNSSSMFNGCTTNLVGGQGTTYNSSNPKDKTYAHLDGGTDNPGYFSAKPYTVTWLNENGTTLGTNSVANGTSPVYSGETPTKEGNAQYSYTFKGWTSDGGTTVYTAELPTGTQDVTYTAVFESTVNTYTVTWQNDDGTILETDTDVAYGTEPTYDGAAPTKEGNAQYTYTFSGWDKAIAAVTGNVTYTAQFSDTVNEYTVTWVDGDGNTLKTDTVAYGDTPEYNGETPTKTATAQYSYTFSGWDNELTAVTGNATYTAQFTETTNTYTVTWVDGDGNTLTTDTVAYGETPVYSGATPTKEGTAQYSYTFSGWTPEISAVTGDVIYTAVFEKTVAFKGTIHPYNDFVVVRGYVGNSESKKTSTIYNGSSGSFDFSRGMDFYSVSKECDIYDENGTQINDLFDLTVEQASSGYNLYTYSPKQNMEKDIYVFDAGTEFTLTIPEGIEIENKDVILSQEGNVYTIKPVSDVTLLSDNLINVYSGSKLLIEDTKYKAVKNNQFVYETRVTGQFNAEISTAKIIRTQAELADVKAGDYIMPSETLNMNDAGYTWFEASKYLQVSNGYYISGSYGTSLRSDTESIGTDAKVYENGSARFVPANPDLCTSGQYDIETYKGNAWKVKFAGEEYSQNRIKLTGVYYPEPAEHEFTWADDNRTATVTFNNGEPVDADVEIETDFENKQFIYTATAVYNGIPYIEVKKVNIYTVEWKNDDGTILETDENVEYGTTPEYNGTTPTKEGTAQYSYTFSGWTPEISAVTGDMTYTAQFTETTNTYTVTWQNEDGTVLETDTDVAYGTTPSYDGAAPTKESTTEYRYIFSGWTPSVDTVTGDVVYTATFTQERHFIDDTHHAWYTFDKETGHMEIYGDGQAFKKQYAFGTFTSSKPNTEVISVHLNNDNGEINTKDFTGWFQSFTALKSVTGKFPAVVERMGSTFYNCKSLTYVEFVPEVTVAATKMFSSCTKLSSIGNADNTIKISCTSYQGVFQGCYVLNANVVFNKSLNAVNIERGYYENAFENAAVWGGNIVVCMTSNVNDETVELIKSTVVNNTSSKKQNISYHHYSDYIDNGDGTHSHTCDVCGESETENHTFDNGICTVCGSKEDYTITVTNGIVAKGEKEIYHVGDIVTLKADEPEEGKVFAYWADGSGNKLSTKANYSFVVLQSVDLTAVYDTEYTAQAILNISAVQTSSNGKNAIRFVFNRSVDTKAQVEEVGLIYATNKLAGYTDGAKVNLAESDFDIETALKDNTNGKVKTYKGTSTSINGTIRLTYTIGNNTDCYVYAYGYVKLTDGTTLYTDLLATTYDSIV